MPKTLILILTLATLALPACAPLIAGGAVIGADAMVEANEGGDGLF